MSSDREQRALRRRSWPGGLVERTTPAQASTPEERLAMMWQLAVDAWTLSGRELPEYTRENIPGKLLSLLLQHGVEFVIVGAHALAVHGVARATGDIDVLVRPEPQNAERVCAALRAFGAPLATHGVSVADFVREGTIYQLGLPPRRIDVITHIDGVSFEQAWAGRQVRRVDDLDVPFLGRPELVQNKRASGRPKDLADLALLDETD